MAKQPDKKASKAGAKGKADAKGKKADKDKKGKKGKGSEAEAAANHGGLPMSIAAHPRARTHVRKAKGLGGLIGFAFAFILSLQASAPMATAGERALMAGVLGYLLGWACSVTIWRQLMIAEMKLAVEQASKRHDGSREG